MREDEQRVVWNVCSTFLQYTHCDGSCRSCARLLWSESEQPAFFLFYTSSLWALSCSWNALLLFRATSHCSLEEEVYRKFSQILTEISVVEDNRIMPDGIWLVCWQSPVGFRGGEDWNTVIVLFTQVLLVNFYFKFMQSLLLQWFKKQVEINLQSRGQRAQNQLAAERDKRQRSLWVPTPRLQGFR